LADRVYTTPEYVFKKIVEAIREGVEGANSENCFLSLDPDDLERAISGAFAYVVSPNAACQFDPGLFDGGRQEQVVVTWPVAVTVHTLSNVDTPGEDAEFLGCGEESVCPPITLVAKVFWGLDPTNDDGNYILAQPVFPYSGHVDRPTRSRGSLQLFGEVKFGWDLSD
jgi:hypothetical protein